MLFKEKNKRKLPSNLYSTLSRTLALECTLQKTVKSLRSTFGLIPRRVQKKKKKIIAHYNPRLYYIVYLRVCTKYL